MSDEAERFIKILDEITEGPAPLDTYRTPPGDRLRNAMQPAIVPVSDDFHVIEPPAKKGRNIFVVVGHALYKDHAAVREFVVKTFGGEWMTPTITFAGDEWKVNPKITDDGQWAYLLMKG